MPAKIILVTGGNHGIGFGVVQAIAQQSTEQHTIIIASRKKGDAEEAIAEAQKWGSDIRFHPLALDVTSDDSISSAVQEVEQVFGRLDVPIPDFLTPRNNISSARGSLTLSASGALPPTASLPYSVSKAALNMLTVEMGKSEPRVRFYAVSPGHCRTAFNGFRGVKEPVEGGRCTAMLVEAEEGYYGNGLWEFEEDQMREVAW